MGGRSRTRLVKAPGEDVDMSGLRGRQQPARQSHHNLIIIVIKDKDVQEVEKKYENASEVTV